MRWKQLSVFLENKPGALSEPCRLLAGAQINIRTFSLADTREFGILRMVVDDPDKARRLLRRHGFAVRVNDVLSSKYLTGRANWRRSWTGWMAAGSM